MKFIKNLLMSVMNWLWAFPSKFIIWFKALSIKKKIAVAILIIIALIIGFNVVSGSSNGPEYDTEPAQKASVKELVSETGHVTAAGVTPVYSTTTGMVEEVLVDNGDTVAEDQTLFKVKATATKQEQETARSNYLTAKSAYDAALSDQLSLQATMFSKWDTFKELAESDDYEEGNGTPKYTARGVPEFHIPEKEWLAAEADYKNQQRVISQTAANLNAKWQAYQATQDSEVESILAGEVRNLGVTKGDLIKVPTATTLSSTSPALVLVSHDVKTTIQIAVNETDILKVKEGQPAEVEFDAIDDKIFPATVERVDTVASADTDVVSYNVYLVLDEQSDLIRSGMTADVDITVEDKEDVLTVPTSAVKPYQGGRAVRVVGKNNEIEFIPVKIGARGDGRTEILSGIEEGTEVIVALPNDQVERSGGLF